MAALYQRCAGGAAERSCGCYDPTADLWAAAAPARSKRWRETLPNGLQAIETFDCVDNAFYDDTNIYTVPGGHSSRVATTRPIRRQRARRPALAYVPLDNLVGRRPA